MLSIKIVKLYPYLFHLSIHQIRRTENFHNTIRCKISEIPSTDYIGEKKMWNSSGKTCFNNALSILGGWLNTLKRIICPKNCTMYYVAIFERFSCNTFRAWSINVNVLSKANISSIKSTKPDMIYGHAYVIRISDIVSFLINIDFCFNMFLFFTERYRFGWTVATRKFANTTNLFAFEWWFKCATAVLQTGKAKNNRIQ